LADLIFEGGQLLEDLSRVTVLDIVVDVFLVAVDAEVVAVGDDVGLRHTEALVGAGPLKLGPVSLLPVGESVGKVVLGVLVLSERPGGAGAEFGGGKELGATGQSAA